MTRAVLGGLVGRSAEWVKAVESGRLLTPRLPLLVRLAEVLKVDDLSTISGLLPNLLTDAQMATRLLEGTERRSALRSLAQTYHLTQLFLSFQPARKLIILSGDRAFIAAQEADNPQVMAVAAWYVNHVFRDAGQQHEARVQLALDAAQLLRPEDSLEDRALWGLLQLAVALSYAKIGHDGNAWNYWDHAHTAARSLPEGYVHPYMLFGIDMVELYAITMNADLLCSREATQQADRVNIDALPSATRRSFHLLEMARAYQQRREHVATVHLIRRAYDESPDTVRFNIFARSAVLELGQRGGATIRSEVDDLDRKLNLVDR